MTSALSSKREFEYIPQRQGGIGFRALFVLKCCECGAEETIDSARKLPDQVIRKKFGQMGWFVGRAYHRDADRCPACMGVGRANVMANKFRVIQDGEPAEPAEEIIERKRQDMDSKTGEILQLMRKTTTETSRTTPPAVADETASERRRGLVLDLTPIENLLNQLVRELRDLRAEVADMRAAAELSMESQERLAERVESMASRPTPEPVRHEITEGAAPIRLSSIGLYKCYTESHMGYLRLNRAFFRDRIKAGHLVSRKVSENLIEYREQDGQVLGRDLGCWRRNVVSSSSKTCAVQTGARFEGSDGSDLVVEIVPGGFNLRRIS